MFMGKVDQNKQEKKERLLETAFSLFTTRGLAKTSISDIAEAAGVAKGTFYLYFRDKYDIGEKLIAHKTGSLFLHAIKKLEAQQIVRFEDRMIAIIDDILDQLNANKLMLKFINKNLSWGIFKHALTKADADIDYLSCLQDMISADPTMNNVTPAEAELLLYTIIELVGSTCHSIILESDPVSLTQYKPYLYQSIRGIIRIQQQT